jgi:hypothetical protein
MGQKRECVLILLNTLIVEILKRDFFEWLYKRHIYPACLYIVIIYSHFFDGKLRVIDQTDREFPRVHSCAGSAIEKTMRCRSYDCLSLGGHQKSIAYMPFGNPFRAAANNSER